MSHFREWAMVYSKLARCLRAVKEKHSFPSADKKVYPGFSACSWLKGKDKKSWDKRKTKKQQNKRKKQNVKKKGKASAISHICCSTIRLSSLSNPPYDSDRWFMGDAWSGRALPCQSLVLLTLLVEDGMLLQCFESSPTFISNWLKL